MRSETIDVEEWSLEHCPCGCGAKLQHPGFRSAARHERELTRYAHLRKSNKQLFRMLVTNLWWELRLAPRRFREWSKRRLQRAELQRVRREMDLELLERSKHYSYGPAEHAARLRLGLPPRVIT